MVLEAPRSLQSSTSICLGCLYCVKLDNYALIEGRCRAWACSPASFGKYSINKLSMVVSSVRWRDRYSNEGLYRKCEEQNNSHLLGWGMVTESGGKYLRLPIALRVDVVSLFTLLRNNLLIEVCRKHFNRLYRSLTCVRTGSNIRPTCYKVITARRGSAVMPRRGGGEGRDGDPALPGQVRACSVCVARWRGNTVHACYRRACFDVSRYFLCDT